MVHSKSTKRLPIEKVSFDRAGSSRMRPTHDVFFEELLAIEILAQRPDEMDRWGVPQGAARPSTNPVLLGKAKEAPATRFRAAASGKGVLDMLHTTTPSREGGGRVWERAEESNPHHSGRPISPTAPKRLPSQLVAPSLPPFHIRICICSPGNQNTLSSLPAANPC